MLKLVACLLLGLIFGLGIAISGMIDPSKIVNFFDVAGTWDPSLACVMAGALAVTLPAYRLILAHGRPLLASGFSLPGRSAVDAPLVGGAALFGVGWGLSGFCPGGVIPALGLGRIEPAVFLLGMAAGIAAVRVLHAGRRSTASA